MNIQLALQNCFLWFYLYSDWCIYSHDVNNLIAYLMWHVKSTITFSHAEWLYDIFTFRTYRVLFTRENWNWKSWSAPSCENRLCILICHHLTRFPNRLQFHPLSVIDISCHPTAKTLKSIVVRTEYLNRYQRQRKRYICFWVCQHWKFDRLTRIVSKCICFHNMLIIKINCSIFRADWYLKVPIQHFREIRKIKLELNGDILNLLNAVVIFLFLLFGMLCWKQWFRHFWKSVSVLLVSILYSKEVLFMILFTYSLWWLIAMNSAVHI